MAKQNSPKYRFDQLLQAASLSGAIALIAVLPLIGGLLVFLGGHETKAEFAGQNQAR
jgi:hypothetical protein